MSAVKKKMRTNKKSKILTQDFLFEIGTEELPPKHLRKLALAFLDLFLEKFTSSGLYYPGYSFEECQVYFSPRRLALHFPGVRVQQEDRVIEQLGPPVAACFDKEGNYTPAATGFAARYGASVEDLIRRDTDKGQRMAYIQKIKGKPASELLPEIVSNALAKLPIGKRMRWGAGDEEFVRPVHWILMILGDKTLKKEILGKKASNKTHGHRFHHPAAIIIKKPAEYRAKLEKIGKVRIEDRARTLATGISKLVIQAANKVKGKPQIEQSLLDEVAALVEWPVAIVGSYDPEFLALPTEVIVAVLQGQQRYFPLYGDDGYLKPYFVTVSNIDSKDPKEVIRGNERVISPRLTDAMFFWKLDLDTGLEARIPALGYMVFQRELGTYADKQSRVAKLAEQITTLIGGEPDFIDRAAKLAKCDLLSNLVGEFPELQGVIGREIAHRSNEDKEVAIAIEEHYLPRFAGDRLPNTKTGQALAIADKLDTLCGIFAIGQKPSGDKDPFALKRAALGLMRILLEQQLDLDIISLIGESIRAQPHAYTVLPAGKITSEAELPEEILSALGEIGAEIYDFLLDRLKYYYLETGIRHDVFESVRAKMPRRPLDFQHRVQAVNEFLKLPEAAALAAANKRISNILRQAGGAPKGEVDMALLKLPEETALHGRIGDLKREVEALAQAGDYSAALQKLAALRAPVDAFFDKVMVMDPDAAVKANRLTLLASLSALFLQTADLALIQVE